MVFFVCSKCNASLRKKQVQQHFITCRPVDVSCVDCSRSFTQQSYALHTTCISEKEKYDGANFKNVVPKGAAKQKSWISYVHSKLRNFNPPPGVPTLMKKKLLESTNVPRKKAKFEFAKKHDIDALWECISKQDNIAKESNGNTKIENSLLRSNVNDVSPIELGPTGNGEPNGESKKIHRRFRKTMKSALSLHKKPMKVKKLRKRTFAEFKGSKHYVKTLHSDKFLEGLFDMVLNSRRFTLSEDKQKVSLTGSNE